MQITYRLLDPSNFVISKGALDISDKTNSTLLHVSMEAILSDDAFKCEFTIQRDSTNNIGVVFTLLIIENPVITHDQFFHAYTDEEMTSIAIKGYSLFQELDLICTINNTEIFY